MEDARNDTIIHNEEDEKANSKFTKISKYVPVEDPEEAHEYEIALKIRPLGIKAAFKISLGTNETSKLEFCVGILPETLIHQAVGLLTSSDTSEDVTTDWAFVTDDTPNPRQILESFSLKDTAEDILPALQPSVTLLPHQLKSFAWQLEQELNPPPFTEQEIVEARIPQLGYRVMGKATRDVHKSGGILAHDVGFGKTVLMLALIHQRKNEDEKWAKELVLREGRLPIKATLVFVPTFLVDQWKLEAEKFLSVQNATPNVLTIENFSDLLELNIHDFQNADIIIVGSKIYQEGKIGYYREYIEKVAEVAGMIPPDDGS
jgi:SNF2 family DNA or RNA helicase